ncbi:MAG: hypothetical protein ACRD4B_06460 [Acidobacteriota bacterium]
MTEPRDLDEQLIDRWSVANLAGLSEQALSNISPLIGGTAAHTIPADSLEKVAQAATVIMTWGDERLEGLLDIMTEHSGYPYGAEMHKLVAIVDSQALQMDIIPKVAYDIDDARYQNGEINGLMLSLMDPEQNADIIFYSWDEAGGEEIKRFFEYVKPGHAAWVKLDKYYLRFALGMDTE